jgi:cyclophilin family peptidyl-prolyl cis-trans isomerase
MSLAAGTYAVFSTTEGKVIVRLFESDAPITVKNFIDLAEGKREWTHPSTHKKSNDKLFDGTIFHRVIPDFMIQGGDPTGTGMGGPGYRFQDETKGSPHKFDKPGKLAMANSGPGTNSSPLLPRLGSPATTPSSAKSSRARRSSPKSPSSPAAARTSPRLPLFLNPSSLSASRSFHPPT